MRTRHSFPESAVRGIAGGAVIRAILYPGRPGTDGTASEFPAKSAGNPWQSRQSPGCDIFALMRRDVPMERKQASEFPQELLNLFDRYVHGEIDRRGFLDGAKKFAVGGMTATAIWESLRPNYAWAQQGDRKNVG